MENETIILNDTTNQQKYYAVHCKCGHVGVNNYIEIVFAVVANNGKEAAIKARKLPRVKHNKKDAIIDCYEISVEKYNEITEINKNDPYLKCKNIQEQRSIEGFESRIVKEPKRATMKMNKKERKAFVQYKLKKQKQLIDAITNAVCEYLVEKGVYCYEIVY